MNKNTGYARRTNWRLPTRTELRSLTNLGDSIAPTIDSSLFPGTIFGNSYYWSATSSLNTGGSTYSRAWVIDFLDSAYYYFGKTADIYVRCVSSGPFSGTQSFTNNGDVTVTDTTTGLRWQKCSGGHTYNTETGDCDGSIAFVNWQTALQYCSGLGGTWRLPSINELESIIDGDQAYPIIDTSVFSGTFVNRFYWASTSTVNIETYAWFITFSSGEYYKDHKEAYEYQHMRCVSGP